MTTNDPTVTSLENVDAFMLQYRQERMPALTEFAKHYSPDVIKTLHDNLLKWALDKLGHETSMRVSNDLFTLSRYVEMHQRGKLDPELALDRVDFCGAPEMQEAIAHVLATMNEDGTLDTVA